MRAAMDGLIRRGSAKNLTDSRGGRGNPWESARKNASARPFPDLFRRPISWPVSQFSTGQARIVAIIYALLALTLVGGCRAQNNRATSETSAGPNATPIRGGHAVASIRTEPRSFNRLAARDSS